jgi:hypothetical protein
MLAISTTRTSSGSCWPTSASHARSMMAAALPRQIRPSAHAGRAVVQDGRRQCCARFRARDVPARRQRQLDHRTGAVQLERRRCCLIRRWMLFCARCFERALQGILSGKSPQALVRHRLWLSRRPATALTSRPTPCSTPWGRGAKRQPRPAPVALVFFNPPEDPVETACLATLSCARKPLRRKANFSWTSHLFEPGRSTYYKDLIETW